MDADGYLDRQAVIYLSKRDRPRDCALTYVLEAEHDLSFREILREGFLQAASSSRTSLLCLLALTKSGQTGNHIIDLENRMNQNTEERSTVCLSASVTKKTCLPNLHRLRLFHGTSPLYIALNVVCLSIVCLYCV